MTDTPAVIQGKLTLTITVVALLCVAQAACTVMLSMRCADLRRDLAATRAEMRQQQHAAAEVDRKLQEDVSALRYLQRGRL